MEPRPIITLTTDFGYKDPFVGIMKGVILKINPSVRIVDIIHDISPQNVAEAAFTLDICYKYFPHKTIHLVVVDPAVGSKRKPLLVVTDYYYFVGPDNGVFSRIYNSSANCRVYQVTAEHHFLSQRSSTFHGRDVFGPVAAWFSKGIDVEKFGDRIYDYVTMPVPVPRILDNSALEGEVIHIDRFGNVITNIELPKIEELLRVNPNKRVKVMVKGIKASIKKYYAEAVDKELYSLINSFGYLEIFVNGGSASRNFDIAVGEKVRVVLV
jgi:S-adenosylmethionine hydrolase